MKGCDVFKLICGFLFILFMFSGCVEEHIEIDEIPDNNEITLKDQDKNPGMQRRIFRSRPQLANAIDELRNSSTPWTRASDVPEDLEYSNNEDLFVSFYEHPQFAIYENPMNTSKKSFIIHIPIANINLNAGKLLGKVFNSAFNTAKNLLSKTAQEESKKYDTQGLFSLENSDRLHIIYGPESRCAFNKRSLESKFYSQWFPYGIKIGFDLSNGLKFNQLTFPDKGKVRLEAGIAYGVIKYKNEWVGAKIIVNE